MTSSPRLVIRCLAALLPVTCSTNLPAQPMPILFGIEIGSPFSVQECPKQGLDWPEMCFISRSYLRAELFWLKTGPPSWATSVAVDLDTNNNVKEMVVLTKGAGVQALVGQLLAERLGKPTASSSVELANAAGLKVTSMLQQWTGAVWEVHFTGVSGKIDSGVLVARSPKLPVKSGPKL
jgi:hypothetical protein